MKGVINPCALGVPIGDGRNQFAFGLHLLVDRRIERNLHLVNCHAVGRQLDGLAHAFTQVGFGFLDHAGNQIDVDLRKTNLAGVRVGAGDLFAVMGPAIDFKDVVVKILNAQA